MAISFNPQANPLAQLHQLQRAQGWPHAEASPHGPDPQARKAETQPDAEPEADQQEVPELEDVPG